MADKDTAMEGALRDAFDLIQDMRSGNIKDEELRYVLKFARVRIDKPFEEVLEDWRRDRADRAQAADIEKHRRERVLSEVEEMFGKDSVQVLLEGVGVNGAADKPKAKKGK